MAFTRFHDDPARVAKQLQQQTDQGRWILDVPGNGVKPCFMLDPQIIPQKWGGNLWTKSIDIQSSLLGIDRPLNRDCLAPNQKYVKGSEPIVYPVCDNLTTEQSRVIMPAWTARDLPQDHSYILPINPQAHTEMNFRNNVTSQDYIKLQPATNSTNNIKEGFANNQGAKFNLKKSEKSDVNANTDNNHRQSSRDQA